MNTSCKWCGIPGSPQCSECWELETRIKQMPLVAKRMVRDAMSDTRAAKFVDAIGCIGSKADTPLVLGVLALSSITVFLIFGVTW